MGHLSNPLSPGSMPRSPALTYPERGTTASTTEWCWGGGGVAETRLCVQQELYRLDTAATWRLRVNMVNMPARAMTKCSSQQTRNICIAFVQCWTNVGDVGPALYKCFVFSGMLLWPSQHINARWWCHWPRH